MEFHVVALFFLNRTKRCVQLVFNDRRFRTAPLNDILFFHLFVGEIPAPNFTGSRRARTHMLRTKSSSSNNKLIATHCRTKKNMSPSIKHEKTLMLKRSNCIEL